MHTTTDYLDHLDRMTDSTGLIQQPSIGPAARERLHDDDNAGLAAVRSTLGQRPKSHLSGINYLSFLDMRAASAAVP